MFCWAPHAQNQQYIAFHPFHDWNTMMPTENMVTCWVRRVYVWVMPLIIRCTFIIIVIIIIIVSAVSGTLRSAWSGNSICKKILWDFGCLPNRYLIAGAFVKTADDAKAKQDLMEGGMSYNNSKSICICTCHYKFLNNVWIVELEMSMRSGHFLQEVMTNWLLLFWILKYVRKV